MKHECFESRTCKCYLLACEPNEECPIHGCPWPPRCAQCGRFFSPEPRPYARDVAILGGDPSL